MKIKHFDTFAGAGWFSLALQQAIWEENIETIWFSEIDKFAIQTYEKNFPWVPNLWSISEIDIDKLEYFDLLTGWFPCQDVSVAGKQNLDWWRTVLVEYLLQILEKKQPKYFVFENVKGLMGKKFTNFRESIIGRILLAWYSYKLQVLNTKDFWLPQNRERVFIVGTNNPNWVDWFDFPKWEELTTFLKDILEDEVEDKFFLTAEQIKWLAKYDSNSRVYNTWWIAPNLNTCWGGHRQVKVSYSPRTREFWTTWWRDISPALSARDYKDPKYLCIKNATKKWYLEAKEWDGIILDNPNSKTKRGRVKEWMSWTLTCAWSDWVITKNLWIRKLTPTEYERLQGFPGGWGLPCSNSQRYKQMWNAISVPVVKEIFKNLLK